MSQADTFDFLNAIDTRLATRKLDQRHHDVLVRLRAMLEEDVITSDASAGLPGGAEAARVDALPARCYGVQCRCPTEAAISNADADSNSDLVRYSPI
jgi:hypothetical protein